MMTMMNESDFQLSSYDYELPEERIAQYPPKERGASRPRRQAKRVWFVFLICWNGW